MLTRKPITKITLLVGIALIVAIFATRSPLLQPTSSGEEYTPQSFSSLLGIDYVKNVWNRIFGSVPVTIEVGSDTDAASNLENENSASCANYKVGDALGRYSTQHGMFLLEDSDGSGLTKEIQYGLKDANWKGLVGDWNGDGWDTIGTYDPAKAKFFLKNQNAPGNADAEFIFNPTNGKGLNNLIPLTGDWNGDKIDTVGLFDPVESRFFLLNKNVASNSADYTFQFGPVQSGWLPIVGDWNGDGKDTVGFYSPGEGAFYLRDKHEPGPADKTFNFGGAKQPYYLPVAGDWNNDGIDTVGLFNNKGAVFLKNAFTGGGADNTYTLTTTDTMELSKRMSMVTGKWKPAQCRAEGQSAVPSDTITPDWVKDITFYLMRIETFTPEGTFKSAIPKLDHLVDLGVTGIYLSAIFEHVLEGKIVDGKTITCGGHNLGAYGPKDLTKIESCLERDGVGFKEFVDAAHNKGLKVIIDIVTHGVSTKSVHLEDPLKKDWFVKNPDGTLYLNPTWGNIPQWNWVHPEFRKWFTQTAIVDSVSKYGVDGFRWDLEPGHAGMIVIKKAKEEVLSQTGKKVFMISESYVRNSRESRGYTTNISEHDYGYLDTVTDPSGAGHDALMNLFNGKRNIVNEIHAGVLKNVQYVGSTISNLNYSEYSARGRLSVLAYGGIISPFIPLMFSGEEFNNPFKSIHPNPDQSKLFFNEIKWDKLKENNTFYQQVKKLIKIRKEYKDIIRPFEKHLADTRIKNITKYSGTDLPPYIMWKDNTAIIVIAKNNTPAGYVNFSLPAKELGWGADTFSWRDLLTDKDMGSGKSYDQKVYVPTGGAVILKVSRGGDTNPNPTIIPTVSLTASQKSNPSNSKSFTWTLTWKSTNASSCKGTGFNTNGQANGSIALTPKQTTTYSILCTGANGITAKANTTVIISKQK